MADSKEFFQGQMKRMADFMEPTEALEVLGTAARSLIAQMDEEQRVDFILGLLGDEDSDKVSSMVHL